MKKLYSLILLVVLTINLKAQSPDKMSYQAVIRDGKSHLVTNRKVGIRISIIKGSPDGLAVYEETHSPITSSNGLVSIEIGVGVSGDYFNEINWTDGPYFIKTETDINGGINYTIEGHSQLMSVPYALHANTADKITGAITENDPLFKSSAANTISQYDITNWNNKSDSQLDETQVDSYVANNGYLTTIATNAVTLAKIADGAANQVLTTDGTGNPQYEDKSNFTSSNLSTARIFVGNLSGVATGVDLSGDATINETGVLAIGNDKVSTAKIADGNVTRVKLEGLDDAQFFIGTDGTSAGNSKTVMSGDVTMTNAGVTTIGNDKVITTKILDANVTRAKLEGLDDAQFIIGTDGTAAGNSKVVMSGDMTMTNTGVTTIGNDKVITSKILDANVTTAKIADGNVTRTKLEGLDDAQFFIGTDGTSAGNSKAVMSGDVTMTNAGVTTIGNDKVITSKILNANVTTAKIADGNVTRVKLEGLEDAQFIIGTDGTTAGNSKVVLSGDVTMTNAGVATIGNDKVTTAKIGTAGAGDADKVLTTNGSGEPQWENRSTFTQLGTSRIYVGNLSGMATAVDMDGDATINKDGQLTISDNVVSSAKIKDKTIALADLSGMGAGLHEYLRYDGSNWETVPDPGTLNYKGAWDASTNSPLLTDGTGTNGDYYVVSEAGSQDLGSGTITFSTRDWAIHNGSEWQQINNSSDVNSVFGRNGIVTTQDNDYTWDQIDKTVSTIADIADVGDATPYSGNLLVADGSQWQSISATGAVVDGGTALATSDQIYDFVAAQAYLSSEVDGSVSNEGSLTVGAGSASTSIISSNTSGSTDVTLEAGTNITLSEADNTITIGVDLSPTYGATPTGPVNPTTATVGDTFYNTTDSALYVYDGTSWVPVDTNSYIFTSGTSMTLGSNSITETNLKGKVNIDQVLHLKPGTAPASPSEGDIYMDATSHKLRCWDGTSWQDLW
jgi:hypothetical protein